jgi:hypothetical protein
MKRIIPTLLAGTLVAFGAGTLVAAADMHEAVVGTWKLNLEKSKYAPGDAPKSLSRTYSESADGITAKITGTQADGSSISQQTTFKYDGKDYPFTGSKSYDALSLARVDANTVKSTLKKGGKPVGTTTRTLSGDGKMLTLKTKWTEPEGKTHEEVAVYDRQ